MDNQQPIEIKHFELQPPKMSQAIEAYFQMLDKRIKEIAEGAPNMKSRNRTDIDQADIEERKAGILALIEEKRRLYERSIWNELVLIPKNAEQING